MFFRQFKTMLLIVMLNGSAHCYSQGNMTLEDLLFQYEKTFISHYPTIHFTTVTKESLNKSTSEEILVANAETVVIKKGDHYDFTKYRQHLNRKSNLLDRGIVTDQSITYSKSLEDDLHYISVTADKEGMAEVYRSMPQNGLDVVVNGYIRGSYLKTYSDLLKENPTLAHSVSERDLDGQTVTYAEINTEYGLCQLWLDPTMGYCPKKIIIKRSAGDKYFKQVIAAPPPPLPTGVIEFLPNEPITEVVLIAYPIKSKQFGNHYFPESAKIIETVTYENGVTANYETDYELKEVDLNPDYEQLNAFVFRSDEIPNGTKVYFNDARDVCGLEYEWYNGTYRATVDSKELELVDSILASFKTEKEIKASSEPNETNYESTGATKETIASKAKDMLPVRLTLISTFAIVTIGFTLSVYLLKRKR